MQPKVSEEALRAARYTADYLERICTEVTTVNLGFGIPTLAAEFLHSENIWLQAENGIFGVGRLAGPGQLDPDLVNASMEPATAVTGCSYTDMSGAFGFIRGGHLDIAVLGAYEVSEAGDIANWMLPGRLLGVGGAMDLVCCARTVIAAMTLTNKGQPKMIRRCSLPVTGYGAVSTVITDKGIFQRTGRGFVLEAIAPGTTVEEIRSQVAFDFPAAPELRVL